MGKAALIISVLVTVAILVSLTGSQEISQNTFTDHTERQMAQLAKDLAEKGQKLVLANWIESNGTATAAHFSSRSSNQGKISIVDYKIDSSVVKITVRGEYGGAVHDITSRFRWNSYGVNPLQIKAADLDLSISSSASLNFEKITLDDQAIQDLDRMLFEELELSGDLGDYGVGVGESTYEIENELLSSGNSIVQVDLMDQAMRDQVSTQSGIFFPDQVHDAINVYLAINPAGQSIISDPASIPLTFNSPDQRVLRVESDVTLANNLAGEGILLIEGDFIVPAGVDLDWQGLVVVSPPMGTLNPVVDFQGNTTINGGLVVSQDPVPNVGHMDLTIFRDMSGVWSIPNGAELDYQGFAYLHKHNYTKKFGNTIRYMAPTSADRIHENRVHFFDTLQKLPPTDEVFIEYMNPIKHGNGVVIVRLKDEPLTANAVAAGFHPSIVTGGNTFRTRPFQVNELEYLQLDVHRLSALQKMWDDPDKLYPNCSSSVGPHCVAEKYNRYTALTLRLYHVNGSYENLIYESSAYWHHKEEDDEDFEEKMEDLVDLLGSDDYGLELTLGDSTIINEDPLAMNLLGVMGGIPTSISNLISTSTTWVPSDPNNPVTKGKVNDVSTN